MREPRLLAIYLNDHLTGATGGDQLFRRAASSFAGSPVGAEVAELADEVSADRESLRRIMRRLDVTENKPQIALGWVAERAGRLKLNGRLFSRSPLSDVVELEGLRLAVSAKTSGWEVLRLVADHDDRLDPAELDALISRAHDQRERLEGLHRRVVEAQLQS